MTRGGEADWAALSFGGFDFIAQNRDEARIWILSDDDVLMDWRFGQSARVVQQVFSTCLLQGSCAI